MSAAAFLAGSVFGLGLALSGLTEPARILAFLDVAGAWDPTLVFVMAGALLVYGVIFRATTRRRTRPLLADTFCIPTSRQLDARLFVGAALFGVGWGLSGLCPGPAIIVLGAGKREALLFVLAMSAGSVLGSLCLRLGPAASGEPARDDA